MTYWQFLTFFLLPPLLVLAITLPRPQHGGRPWWRSLAVLVVLALVYTTPWDNYLVANQIWGYGDDRVLATIGYVPVEEYLFFILQPVLTGLFLYHLLRRRDRRVATNRTGPARWIGAGLFAVLGLAGIWMMDQPGGRYLGLILVWAGPVLAGQWAYGGDVLWNARRAGTIAIVVPTVYLWIADWWAIRDGVWHLSATDTLGWTLAGLPVEEATFFLLTNALVVQGLLLLLYPPGTDTDRSDG